MKGFCISKRKHSNCTCFLTERCLHLFSYYYLNLLDILLEILSGNQDCEILNTYSSPWSSIKNKPWVIGKSFKIIGELNFQMSLCHKMGEKNYQPRWKIVQNHLHSIKKCLCLEMRSVLGGEGSWRVAASYLPFWRKHAHYISCVSEQRNLNKGNAVNQILFSVK